MSAVGLVNVEASARQSMLNSLRKCFALPRRTRDATKVFASLSPSPMYREVACSFRRGRHPSPMAQ